MAKITKQGNVYKAERDLETPLKGMQVNLRCYLDKAPVVMMNPDCPFILREKKSNKAIIGWQLVNRVDGQKVQVAHKEKDNELNDFLVKAGNDETIGEALKDRNNEEYCIMVTGFYLSMDDKQINLLNPIFRA